MLDALLILRMLKTAHANLLWRIPWNLYSLLQFITSIQCRLLDFQSAPSAVLAVMGFYCGASLVVLASVMVILSWLLISVLLTGSETFTDQFPSLVCIGSWEPIRCQAGLVSWAVGAHSRGQVWILKFTCVFYPQGIAVIVIFLQIQGCITTIIMNLYTSIIVVNYIYFITIL